MSTRSILINDELTAVPDDLAKAISNVRADAKAKKKAMMEEEMEDEEEDMEEYEDSADDDELDEAIEAVLDENDELAEKNDSLEAENAVLKAIAMQQSQHQDSEDDEDEEEEDDEEYLEDSEDEELTDEEIEDIVFENREQIVRTDTIEQYVAARLDDILSSYDEAKPFLPADFNVRDHADGYEIKVAALRNSLPHLDDADSGMIWDSADAIDAAFAILVKQGLRADSRYVPLADRVVNTRQDSDLAPMGKTQKRVRKPNYSI